MLEQRRLDLVGDAEQALRALQGLVHLHQRRRLDAGRALHRLDLVDHLEALDGLFDLHHHDLLPWVWPIACEPAAARQYLP
ncbi:hypothetical protein D9M68_857290 [compost metagenome]